MAIARRSTPGDLADRLSKSAAKRDAEVAAAQKRHAAVRDTVVTTAVSRMDAANALIAELHTEINDLGKVIEKADVR